MKILIGFIIFVILFLLLFIICAIKLAKEADEKGIK